VRGSGRLCAYAPAPSRLASLTAGALLLSLSISFPARSQDGGAVWSGDGYGHVEQPVSVHVPGGWRCVHGPGQLPVPDHGRPAAYAQQVAVPVAHLRRVRAAPNGAGPTRAPRSTQAGPQPKAAQAYELGGCTRQAADSGRQQLTASRRWLTRISRSPVPSATTTSARHTIEVISPICSGKFLSTKPLLASSAYNKPRPVPKTTWRHDGGEITGRERSVGWS